MDRGEDLRYSHKSSGSKTMVVADIDGEIKILTSNTLKIVADEFGIPLY